ncbi:uncharacterized protein [Hemitrygon akajei]|uniref:uncharacterized protein n=1 Tax=Hemitrygon akajei TaxID=2704970 RepID=UPI003BF987B0
MNTIVLKMAERAASGAVPVKSTAGKVTGPTSVITELLASWNDFQLLQLTDFYRDRLEQAMEGGVHGVSLALTAENQFSGVEHRKISDLADKGERADSSKLLLSLVMEKGSRARRVMWETFVKMRNGVPKYNKILKEIQQHGCVPVHGPVPKIPSELKATINLRELILDQYPYFGNFLREVWKNPEGLLFIFDGLDEFKHKIDFADSRRDTEPKHQCPDPEWWCEVSDIVYSLIQGKLLPGCSVLVTTRPTALHLMEKAEISIWGEIMGFDGEERKEYFIRYFEDRMVAAAVFKHVEENDILYTMCYNPSYCWILALALGPFFIQRVRNTQRVPKTITQLYSYYIYNILKNHGREIENPRDVLLRVGQMAFRGVFDKKIIFTDGHLINYNLKFLTEAHNTTDGRFEIFLRFHLDLFRCRIQCEGIQRLEPGLYKCRDLRLAGNKLGDSGVKVVSAALRNPECKIQELVLINVGLSDSGVEDLVSALRANRSLTLLDLALNSLTDRSIPALRPLILTHPSLNWIGLVENQFSRTGEKELRSMQEPRTGLTVKL